MTNFNSTQPIARKSAFRISFTYITMDGTIKGGTRWYNDILEIPVKYFGEDNAKLWERSFDVFEKPTLEQLEESIESGNKFWLNTSETIKQLNY